MPPQMRVCSLFVRECQGKSGNDVRGEGIGPYDREGALRRAHGLRGELAGDVGAKTGWQAGEDRVHKAGEAPVEVVAAERDNAAGALGDDADDARHAELADVVGQIALGRDVTERAADGTASF